MFVWNSLRYWWEVETLAWNWVAWRTKKRYLLISVRKRDIKVGYLRGIKCQARFLEIILKKCSIKSVSKDFVGEDNKGLK